MKIEKKEDLANTYIVNDCPVKRDAYLQKLMEFGFYVGAGLDYDNGHYIVCEPDEYGVSVATEKWKSKCNSKQLHLSDLIDLENSKVYTTDAEVIRKFSELVGFVVSEIHYPSLAGVCFCREAQNVDTFLFGFELGVPVDYKGETIKGVKIKTITTEQINALYAEKFSDTGTETPEEKEVLDSIEQAIKNGIVLGAVNYYTSDGGYLSSAMEHEAERMKKTIYDRTAGGSVKAISPEWDGSGLPPVGFPCVYVFNDETEYSGFVAAYHDDAVWFSCDGGLYKTFIAVSHEFRKPETEAERNERARKELVNDICEELFGEMADQYRPDVTGTINAMLDAGYRKG